MEELVAWVKSHGATLHPSVEVYNDPSTGNSFRVSDDGAGISPGETIVTCPLGLTLSCLNATTTPSPGFHHDDTTSSSSTFPPSFLETVPPHVISRFFLIQQYLLGKRSFWYPYIRTLPQPEHLQSWILPPLWPSDDIELLEDTNIHVAISEIKSRLKSEFKHAIAAFAEAPARHDYTRLLYNWAYCIFTSRSFRPSLVIPAQIQDTLSLPQGCAIDDFSLLLPLFDVGNHSPKARISWDSDAATNICSLRTLDTYGPGNQVFNNYGTTKTNAELMIAYGFRIPESETLHNDYIHVKPRSAASSADVDTGPAKPRDFLVSLRPAIDPSSVAVRSMQMLPDIDVTGVFPMFRYVQDSMVWDLVLAHTTAEQREKLLPVPEGVDAGNADLARLHMVLDARIPKDFSPILSQIIGIIQHKAILELERLEQSDFELEESEATRNQLMAYEYRGQCRKILINVLQSLELPEGSE
ncbi:Ribosomal lysine N-methyltransferase set10 [Colletotrichum chlorophyti]|uniref:Ribosomal lysine N-methyltransferase set10 n=1 Tax=Colletotrichum chlorophyti TaxID=708187 RepID=A0A1Q8RAY6_9PEZI|nr:Ribosomal lysine N-methyltransferase set10 [Colletotrichum chlorophyti]